MDQGRCVVGVDWGDRKHAYVVARERARGRGEFAADPEAIHTWVNTLRGLSPEGPIVVAVEQSRGPLIYALQRYDFIELVPVNPRAAKAYRESLYLSGAKDDPVDAELLCDFVLAHEGKLRRWQPDDARTRELRLLVEGRRALVGQRTSTTQALTAVLKQYFPQILTWFGDANSKLARAFVERWPTLEAAVHARRDAIIGLVRQHSRKKPAQLETLISQIRGAVALTNDPALIEPLSLLARSYVALLEVLEESIARFDDEAEKLWESHPDHDLFDSFPGAGPVLGPRLAVAFGLNRGRYDAASEIQRYSGIAPVIERSGRQCWTHSRFRCPKFLKQTFHEFAAASLPHSRWALAYYRQQCERGAGHHAAVRSLAFRWIRILYHCWKNNVPYREEEHISTLQRRRSPLVRRLVA